MMESCSNNEPFREALLKYVQKKSYRPLGAKALFRKLAVNVKFYPLCKTVLEELVREKVLEFRGGKYELKTPEAESITGVVRMHAKGFGFVEPNHPTQYGQDIFIPKHLTENALDGDKVRVEINPLFNREKGPDGKIVSILKREHEQVGGILHQIEPGGIGYVYAPLFGPNKLISVSIKDHFKVGDRVLLKIDTWGDDKKGPQGEILHFFGNISDPSCDIRAAEEEFNLRYQFSSEVLEEALAKGDHVDEVELKGREDYTPVTTMTIDPETAKDFDDALSIVKTKGGGYRLAVHIADVAHYVKKDSLIDIEALERGNSTYFPGYCLPMLPHELSDNLCSLQPGVIRLTVTVLMEFDLTGSLLNYKIQRSYIKSCKRFTYEEAKGVLDGKIKSPHFEALQLMVELCLLLKNKRYERGSIDFSLPELVIVVDEKGKPYKTKRVEYDISHQLVEEFMLKANEVVAKHLISRGRPALFRIHENPSQENFDDFCAMARCWGFFVPKDPKKQDLQRLFEEAKGSPYAQQLAIGFIRSMKLAFYSSENIGHYGLSLEHYAHFTSPIRRYTDLVIQRLLFNEEGKEDHLSEVAERCSERERISF